MLTQACAGLNATTILPLWIAGEAWRPVCYPLLELSNISCWSSLLCVVPTIMQSACMTTCYEAAGITNSFVRWGTTQINWWSSLAYDCRSSLISWVAFHVLPGSSQSCVVVKCVIVCTRFCVAYSVSCKQMLSNQRAAMAAVWKVTRGLHWNTSSCLVSLLQRHVEKAG